MIKAVLDAFSWLFSVGRGRPMALVVLATLLAGILSESDRPRSEGHLIADWQHRLALPLKLGREALFDGYQKLHPRVPQSNPVTIIAIDEKSLTQVGQWPWPRNKTAELIRAITAHGPAAIGLDIYMPEEDQTSPQRVAANLPPERAALAEQLRKLPTHEAQLAAALQASPSVLGAAGFDFETLATSAGMRTVPVAVQGSGDPLQFVRSYPWVLASLPELQMAAQGQAVLSVDMDDGVVRRMPLVMAINGTLVPGLGMEMLRVATGEPVTLEMGRSGVAALKIADLSVPTQPGGEIWLHFARHATGAGRYAPAVDVLNGQVDPELLAGKLVMIGLTGFGLMDQRMTALGEIVPGIEIQAQVVDSLFDGRFLTRPAWLHWLEILVSLVMAAMLIVRLPRGETSFGTVLETLPRALLWVIFGLGALLFLIGYVLFMFAGLLLNGVAIFVIVSTVLISLTTSAMIEIGRRNKLLAEEQQRMREQAAKAAGELSAAGRIQLGSLPSPELLFRDEMRFQLVTLLEPAKDVGGDLYDCFMIDDHQLGFVVGDVSGKGLPASIFMAVTKTLTKTIAKHVGSGPAKVAELSNNELAEVNPESLFVTLLVGVLDVESGLLTLVNAGHDGPWIIHREGGLGQLECPPDAGGPPLCMLDGFPYSAQQAQLQPGDTLVMYTDGITEAMNPVNEIYGLQRLEAALRDAATQDVHDLLASIRTDVGHHVAEAEPSDDMTLMVIRWTPTPQPN